MLKIKINAFRNTLPHTKIKTQKTMSSGGGYKKKMKSVSTSSRLFFLQGYCPYWTT
jgi:hypothetical protein